MSILKAGNRYTDLIEELIENPELIKNDITNDQLLEIYKEIDPYSYIPISQDPNKKRIAITSYTNLREDYLRRFTMTALIGFLIQASNEYEIPNEHRRWDPKKSKRTAMYEQMTLDDLSERISVIQAVIEEGKKAKTQGDLEGYTFTANTLTLLLGEETKKRFPDISNIEDNQSEQLKEFLSQHKEEINKINALKAGTIEVPPKVAKNILKGFVDYFFEYDPNIHVRSAKANKKLGLETPDSTKKYDLVDPECVVLQNLTSKMQLKKADADTKDAIRTVMSSKLNYNASSIVLNNVELSNAITYLNNNRDKYNKFLKNYIDPEIKCVLDTIPPQDLYHNWNFYVSANYESIRKATEAIYHDKPDLDWAIQLIDTFEGTEEEIKKKYQKFKETHEKLLKTDIKLIEFGGWTFLADFKENREKLDIYNKKTETLQQIIEQHEKDEQLADEMLNKKIQVKKAKNIAELGPDDPALQKYKDGMGPKMDSLGVNKGISDQDMKRLEVARGNIELANELKYIDNLKEEIAKLKDLRDLNTIDAQQINELNLKETLLKQAMEGLDVPEDAQMVEIYINDGGDEMVKSVMYTKHTGIPENLENLTDTGKVPAVRAQHQQAIKKEQKENKKSNQQGVELGKAAILDSTGEHLEVEDMAPFAKALYENANGAQDLMKMEFVEEVDSNGNLVTRLVNK